MASADVRRVLIVGGGIAGMCLPVALRSSGLQTEIAEINPEWTALGVGIALTAPACRALNQLGLLQPCVDAGWSVTKLGRVNPNTHEAEYVGEAPRLLGPDYPASLGIMRPVFHQILAQAAQAAGAAVRLGLTVDGVDQQADDVDVTFSDGSRGRYDLVVGADGIHSRVRELVWGPEVRPAFTGQAVWRITVPRDPAVEAIVSVPGGPNPNVGFNPVSPELMYVFVVENTPVRTRPTGEDLVRQARAHLDGYGRLVARARAHITSPDQITMRPMEAILVPPPWNRGRVVLIGDAAHATTPHLASGACIAIEDGVVLGDLLRGDGPLPDVLNTFVERRYERCQAVVEGSLQLGQWQLHPDTPGADPAALARSIQQGLLQPI